MLCLLIPFLINPFLWFSLDLPIFAGAIGLSLLISALPGSSPFLGLLVALF